VISSLRQDRVRLSQPDLELREVRGHNPKEVAVGALVGIFFALLFNYQHIAPFTGWLGAIPGHIELFAYAALAVILIVGGLIQWAGLRRRRSAALTSVSHHILVAAETTGIIMAVFVICAFERVNYLSSRVCFLATIVIMIAWSGWLYRRHHHRLAVAMALEAESVRKDKWLPKSRKQRKKKRA
jgi:hypothetical protein